MTGDVDTELCWRIVAQMPEAVILADRAGRIRLWNRGAEVLFGHPAMEAMGQSLDIIIPEDLRYRHWTGYHRAIAAGRTRAHVKWINTIWKQLCHFLSFRCVLHFGRRTGG